MRSSGNDFNYFILTKLANFVQFKRMLMFCQEDWAGAWALPLFPLGYATALYITKIIYLLTYLLTYLHKTNRWHCRASCSKTNLFVKPRRPTNFRPTLPKRKVQHC